MKKALMMALLCSFLFTGCGSRQVEEELLVIVLAIDQTEQNDLTVAVKVPTNASAASDSTDHSQNGQAGYMLLEATGHTFSDAVSMLNATTPRRLNFSQVREIIIGEAASKHSDFAALLRQIYALPRFRCSAAVIICRKDALSFAEEQKPYVGMRLSRYAENTLANYAGKGFSPSTDLCAGVRDMGFGFQDPLFILGAVNDFSDRQTADEDNSLNQKAGSLPRKSIEAVELFGAAATDGVSVSGYLTGYEMALLHLIAGHVEALMIQIDGIPLHITSRTPAALSVDVSKKPAVLGISLLCEAQYPPGRKPDEAVIQRMLQQDILSVVHHLQSMNCDGIGFGNVAVQKFLTVQSWEAFQWRKAYAQAQTTAEVWVQCREK